MLDTPRDDRRVRIDIHILDEMDRLREIADRNPDAEFVAAAKRLVPPTDLADGLKAEHDAWAELVSVPLPAQLMTRALERGVQTPEGERDLESVMRGISATL